VRACVCRPAWRSVLGAGEWGEGAGGGRGE